MHVLSYHIPSLICLPSGGGLIDEDFSTNIIYQLTWKYFEVKIGGGLIVEVGLLAMAYGNIVLSTLVSIDWHLCSIHLYVLFVSLILILIHDVGYTSDACVYHGGSLRTGTAIQE